jgi:hypothetical protein
MNVPNPDALRDVEFDIAVTVTSSDKVGGEGGIQVMGIFKAGGEASKAAEKSSVSRIKFTVPMRL